MNSSAQTCTENIYMITEWDDTFLQAVFTPLLTGLVVSVPVSALFGFLAFWNEIYPSVAVMAMGVMTKLALIPEIGDIVDSVAFDTTQGEEEKDYKVDKKYGKMQQFLNNTRKSCWDRIRFRKVVFFTAESNSSKERYWMHPCFATYQFAVAMLQILTYGSVYVTSQWEFTTQCRERNIANAPKTCYYKFEECPPVNCTLWEESGIEGKLLCISAAPDPYTPLERFVSLLAVQAAVLKVFATILNRGCPIRPITRYCGLCLCNAGFVAVLIVVTSVVGTVEITRADRETTFAELTIPFFHMMAVAASETSALFIVVFMMWIVGPEDYDTTRKKNKRK